MNYRKAFISKLNENISNVYYKIMKQEGLKINYVCNLPCCDKNELIKFYRENFVNEISQKVTLFGPHRDDFDFYLHDENLKLYGSQGQQRTVILTLKLAELEVIKDEIGESPILLLDDFMSELDNNRKINFLKNIKETQIIITCTDDINIENVYINKFKVEDGKVLKFNT